MLSKAKIRQLLTVSGLAMTVIAGSLALGEQPATTSLTNMRRGQLLFITQCRACHAADANQEPLKIGPSLYRLLGRKAGTLADYKYSDGMKKSEITWTREQLDLWLQNPSVVVPGSIMTFVGLPQASDRVALIEYLAADPAVPQ
jgi:cytochrome c